MRTKICAMASIYLIVLGLFTVAVICSDHGITVLSENAPFTDRACVILDAGHGGEDGGAISFSGTAESTINLEISLRLEDLFHLIGVNTFMIRRDDISVYTSGTTLSEKKISDLKHRVKLINQMEDPILLSIHQNHYVDQRYSGTQVFFAATEGSDRLAKSLQTSIVRALNPSNNRKAQKADSVYLMKHINCTGVLIECGFLSNPNEEVMLKNPDYQKKLCSVIVTTVSNYLDRKESH